MAITVEKAWNDTEGDGDGDGASREVRYIISGTDSYDAAETAFLADADPESGGLVGVHYTLTRLSDNHWLGVLTHGTVSIIPGVRPDPPQTKDDPSELSFDTTGGSKHIKVYRGTPTKYAASGKEVPDLGGAINVSPDLGGVDGADIGEAACRINVTKVLTSAELPSTYLNTVWRLTYCVNSSPMLLNVDGKLLSFDAGELLFLGASLNYKRGTKEWRITYQFAAKPNETRSYGYVPSIFVKGWQYVSFWFAPTAVTQGGKNFVVPQADGVWVGDVYTEANLSLLGV